MNRNKIAVAAAEAERFLERVKALPEQGYYEHHERKYPLSYPVEMGSIRRASMDLTRALADLRKVN